MVKIFTPFLWAFAESDYSNPCIYNEGKPFLVKLIDEAFLPGFYTSIPQVLPMVQFSPLQWLIRNHTSST